MPTKQTKQRAKQAKRAGKKPTTQAGAFVAEEMRKMKRGSGAKNPKQAIAIGLAEARREGVAIPDKPKKRPAKKKTAAKKKSTAKRTRSR